MSIEETAEVDELRAEVLRSVEDETRHEVTSQAHVAAVTLNIAPDAIPYDGSDKRELVKAVAEQFGAAYQPPKGISPEVIQTLSLDSLMDATRLNGDLVSFKGGRLQIPGSERITPIRRIAFGEQTLLAEVSGVTSEALHICRELLLLMWNATGIVRRWHELGDLVEHESYATTTVVELGVPLIRVLSAETRAFLEDGIAGANGFGNSMGGTYKAPRGPLKIVPYCREVDLRVSVFDETTGNASDCTLNLLLHTRLDANRSRVKVTSDLESARHNEMVVQLVHTLNQR